jgi:pimeloyl-ACP methyl ester carboxylesterase
MPLPRIRRASEEILNESGETIACDVRSDPDAGVKPALIVCHSFMSFKDWGFFPHAAERFAEEGFAAVSFNFSRNGVPPGADRITDFAAFASNSFTREILDLGCVVGAIREGRLGAGSCDPGRIVLLGHSRGGGIAASYASGDPGIAALVTWSAVATFDRWTRHQKETWRRDGSLGLSRGDGGAGPLRLGAETLEDLDRRLVGIDPLLRAPYITAPWLIVHGKADLTVPAREAESLAQASGSPRTELLLLDSVGHLYHARSAEEDHYIALNNVISLTVAWLRGVLQYKENV